jgi:hypothetical protein
MASKPKKEDEGPPPNPQVFFDISVGGVPLGKIVMELFVVRIGSRFCRPPRV